MKVSQPLSAVKRHCRPSPPTLYMQVRIYSKYENLEMDYIVYDHMSFGNSLDFFFFVFANCVEIVQNVHMLYE
jgi:hypothetical protein